MIKSLSATISVFTIAVMMIGCTSKNEVDASKTEADKVLDEMEGIEVDLTHIFNSTPPDKEKDVINSPKFKELMAKVQVTGVRWKQIKDSLTPEQKARHEEISRKLRLLGGME